MQEDCKFLRQEAAKMKGTQKRKYLKRTSTGRKRRIMKASKKTAENVKRRKGGESAGIANLVA